MKPLLAGKFDSTKAMFPLLASIKIDGVRALVIDGVLMSRSLKPIPNAWCQQQFSGLPNGTDGELVFGLVTLPDCYRNTVSAVMSEDGEPEEVRFRIFDNFLTAGGFQTRFAKLAARKYASTTVVVPHILIHNAEELAAFENECVEAGHEGVMVRSLDGEYKFGRSTTNEGILLKVKRFADADAEILSTYEWETNNNEAKTNALGRTERSSHQENKVGAGVLGGFNVVGLEEPYKGVEFSIGTGFQGADDPSGERGQLWKKRQSLVGQIVKFKYFATGSLVRPRFPVFIGFRNIIDTGGAIVKRKSRSKKFSHTPQPLPCDGAPKLRMRYPCGCVLTVESQKVFLTLAVPPVAGKQKRFIGRLDNAVLHIFRAGREFFRRRSCYGLDQHIIRAARQIGFDRIHVTTPARAGFLRASIDELLARRPFQYHTYEAQVPFKIAEIRGAA